MSFSAEWLMCPSVRKLMGDGEFSSDFMLKLRVVDALFLRLSGWETLMGVRYLLFAR